MRSRKTRSEPPRFAPLHLTASNDAEPRFTLGDLWRLRLTDADAPVAWRSQYKRLTDGQNIAGAQRYEWDGLSENDCPVYMRGARYVRWHRRGNTYAIIELVERYYRATKVTCTDADEWRGHVEKMMQRLKKHPLMGAPIVWTRVYERLCDLVSNYRLMIGGVSRDVSGEAVGHLKAIHKVMRKLEPFEAQEAT